MHLKEQVFFIHINTPYINVLLKIDYKNHNTQKHVKKLVVNYGSRPNSV